VSLTTERPTPTGGPTARLQPARLPTGPGTIGWLGPVLALLVVGVGVLAGQDAWVRLQGGSTTWLGSATGALDGLAPSAAVAAVGVVVALVGLWLVVAALKPRTRDALPLGGTSGAHLRTADVARLASGAADQVDGVLRTRSSASRRSVTVDVTTTAARGGAADGVADRVRTGVEHALRALETPPRVRVRTTASKGDDQ
jgi:hypothetical protein